MCGASTTKRSMINIRKRFIENKLDAKIILTVHDEVLAIAHIDDAIKAAEIIKEEMKRAFNHYAPTVPMNVVPLIKDYWAH